MIGVRQFMVMDPDGFLLRFDKNLGGHPKPAMSAGVSTDPGRPPRRAPSASACEPYRELIAEALDRGRNAMAIWQDLVDDHGFAAQYASVRRFVVALRGSSPAEARVVITT